MYLLLAHYSVFPIIIVDYHVSHIAHMLLANYSVFPIIMVDHHVSHISLIVIRFEWS